MTAMIRRLAAVDALRGAVMIVMALDHVRDFIHRGAMSGSPTDLATTTPILFMTRWVTHFCAPVFMLTAGLGAYFYLSRPSHAEGGSAGARTKGQLSRFLISRALWLIVLELTLMQFAYNFNLAPTNPIFMLVLYVLGACMIILAALIWLPMNVLAAVSIAIVLLHNSLEGIRAQSLGSFAPMWILLHQVGAIPFAGRIFIAPYSLIPWFAVMALGFCLGPLFAKDPERRRQNLMRVGVMMTIAFVLVRAVNLYGDPSRWSSQPSSSLSYRSGLLL